MRADSVVAEERRREREGGRKQQGVTLLKLQPDSMIYIEAFVKMPFRLEQEANYKSHPGTCSYTHAALARIAERRKNDQ